MTDILKHSTKISVINCETITRKIPIEKIVHLYDGRL